MASELIVRDIYAGKYQLTHNPNAKGSQPRYVLLTKDTGIKTKPKGVTTIMGAVIAKDLMQWAADCAVGYIKELLPVVTEEDLKQAAKAYTVKRDAGASTGTEAHALVEKFLKAMDGVGRIGNDEVAAATQEARNAYNAFVHWFDAVRPEVINVEEVIYSEAYDIGGTYDAMMRIDGKVMLTDLKTTNASRKAPNGVYAENFIQLGLYALAHEERRVYEAANGGTDLVQVEGLAVISAKKNGKMDVVTNEDLGLTLEDCMGMGRRVVDLYRFLQYTTNKLGGK